jgi:excisionase family DNA binding protein
MSDTDLMTAAEVADSLKISAETVRAWCRRGRIPGHRYSHKVLRFRLGEVVAALEAARRRETCAPDAPRERHETASAAPVGA